MKKRIKAIKSFFYDKKAISGIKKAFLIMKKRMLAIKSFFYDKKSFLAIKKLL